MSQVAENPLSVPLAGMAEMDELFRRAWRIKDFCRAFGLGRTSVYLELKNGRLLAAKCGKVTLIINAEEWLATLPPAKSTEKVPP
jgi:hypothetical protein